MKTLMEIGANECHFPVGDELPAQNALAGRMPHAKHSMCGEPTTSTKPPYCEKHLKTSSGGRGKDWQALAGMIEAMEQTVRKVSEEWAEGYETEASQDLVEMTDGKVAGVYRLQSKRA